MGETVNINAFDWSQWRRSPSVCAVCSEVVVRPTIIFDDSGSRIYCRRHIPRRHLIGAVDRAKNVFANFTLDHVRDEHGKKVTVNSVKELRAAEKRYNFSLACATNDNGNVDEPPQHESWAGDIRHGYQKKFNRDPAAYSDPRNQSTGGVADSAGNTLAALPNPSGSIAARIKRGE